MTFSFIMSQELCWTLEISPSIHKLDDKKLYPPRLNWRYREGSNRLRVWCERNTGCSGENVKVHIWSCAGRKTPWRRWCLETTRTFFQGNKEYMRVFQEEGTEFSKSPIEGRIIELSNSLGHCAQRVKNLSGQGICKTWWILWRLSIHWSGNDGIQIWL